MIPGRMERTLGGGERQTYPAAVADLWERVGSALTRLERIAEAPDEALADEVVDELRGLRYTLHSGAELAVGIEPPLEAETLHAELVSALSEARDVTAEVAHVLELGEPELVDPLLPEWRGSLFRVRLARLRALQHSPFAAPRTSPGTPERAERREEARAALWAVAAGILVLVGAALFTAGAVLGDWPVWAAGLGLFAGGFILSRP
jgi:hypothetical protein